MSDVLLDIEGLEVQFQTENGIVSPVKGVNLQVKVGEITALVGESGSGKSVTSLAIMGLLPRPNGSIFAGNIFFQNQNLVSLSSQQIRKLRGKEIAMVFQEPMTSLNPVLSIGEQIAEQVREHLGLDKRAAFLHAIDMLERVEIPDAKRRASDYPHQMSGGMRQRVMLALAMSCKPKLLIADEPTTALDVTIQAQILALIDKLRQENNMGVLFITHNLGVVAQIAHQVSVMYAGEVVETSDVHTLFKAPKHPYTRALLDCLPAKARLGSDGRRLVQSIKGSVASSTGVQIGCKFSPRCEFMQEKCTAQALTLEIISPTQNVRCVRWREI